MDNENLTLVKKSKKYLLLASNKYMLSQFFELYNEINNICMTNCYYNFEIVIDGNFVDLKADQQQTYKYKFSMRSNEMSLKIYQTTYAFVDYSMEDFKNIEKIGLNIMLYEKGILNSVCRLIYEELEKRMENIMDIFPFYP